MTVAALDIGGANIKGARSDGGGAFSSPFALWRAPRGLAKALEQSVRQLQPFHRLAVTMTGELCDCFANRSEGVRHILESVIAVARRSAPRVPVDVWLLDGRLASVDEALAQPRKAAAANWLALATWAACRAGEGDGILIDIGSTTSDLVALRGGQARPLGLTDTERLQSGELVYSGVGRTPVFALVQEVVYRGRRCRVAAENFSTTLDVYLLLGDLPEDPRSLETADGREATRERAAERLARVICADPPTFAVDEARELATQIASAQIGALEAAFHQVKGSSGTLPEVAVVSGRGEFLARKMAESQGISRLLALSELTDPASSEAACAVALACLAAERLERPDNRGRS